jgi:CBS domain-containing protein
VTRQESGGIEQQVVGLITYYEIERSRPHRYPQATVPSTDRIIRVTDVMTPWNELWLVNYESQQTLIASDVYEMLQGTADSSPRFSITSKWVKPRCDGACRYCDELRDE